MMKTNFNCRFFSLAYSPILTIDSFRLYLDPSVAENFPWRPNRLDPPTGRSQLLRHYSPLGDPSVSMANVIEGPRPRRQGKTVNVGPTPSRRSAPGEEPFVFSRSPSGASPPPLSSPLDRVRNAPRTAPTRIRFMEKNDREVIKNLQRRWPPPSSALTIKSESCP